MTKDLDKKSGKDNHEKSEDAFPENNPIERTGIAYFDSDTNSEHDYYDKSMSASPRDELIGATSDITTDAMEDGFHLEGAIDSSTESQTTADSEFLDLGAPAGAGATAILAATGRKTVPKNDSDALVHWLRHGDELDLEEVDRTTPGTAIDSVIPASRAKRLLARVIDMTWILSLLLVGLSAFLNFVNSPSFALVSQSLLVQLVLAIVLLPLALILEAAILSDFGNSPGKYLLGLKITGTEKNEIKFRHYLSRAGLLWFMGLACGIPVLIIAAILWQGWQVSKNKTTRYDKILAMQVTAVKTSWKRKLGFLLFTLTICGALNYIAASSIEFPRIADTWATAQTYLENLIGEH